MQEEKATFNDNNPNNVLPNDLFVPTSGSFADALWCMSGALSNCQADFNKAQREFTLRGLLKLINIISDIIPDELNDDEYANTLYIYIHMHKTINFLQSLFIRRNWSTTSVAIFFVVAGHLHGRMKLKELHLNKHWKIFPGILAMVDPDNANEMYTTDYFVFRMAINSCHFSF